MMEARINFGITVLVSDLDDDADEDAILDKAYELAEEIYGENLIRDCWADVVSVDEV